MNNDIFFFFYNLAHQSEFFDQIVIFTADIFPYMVLILAGLFVLFHHEIFKAESPWQVFRQKKKEILGVFFSVFTVYILAGLLKIYFHTLRPFAVLPDVFSLFNQTGYAFPSGHSAVMSAVAFAIFFQHKKAGYVFMFLALLIGLARIVAGVHFPIDILGGFILGAFVAYFIKNI